MKKKLHLEEVHFWIELHWIVWKLIRRIAWISNILFSLVEMKIRIDYIFINNNKITKTCRKWIFYKMSHLVTNKLIINNPLIYDKFYIKLICNQMRVMRHFIVVEYIINSDFHLNQVVEPYVRNPCDSASPFPYNPMEFHPKMHLLQMQFFFIKNSQKIQSLIIPNYIPQSLTE